MTKVYLKAGEKKRTNENKINNKATVMMACSIAAYDLDEALFANTKTIPVDKKVVRSQMVG